MEFYRQTSVYTGAPAALLMALHHNDPQAWPLECEQEFSIWIASANLPTRSSSIYALGMIAKKAGYDVHAIVGEREYDYPDYRFKRYKKVEIDDAKYSSRLHARRAREAGVTVEEREFGLEEVDEHLNQGSMVLLRVNAGVLRDRRATSKYVLVREYDEEQGYSVMDPAQGEMHISQEEMQEAFETLVTKKKRDHRMLVLSRKQ